MARPTLWQTKIKVDTDPDIGLILRCQGMRDYYMHEAAAYPPQGAKVVRGKAAAYQELLVKLLGMPYLGTPATDKQVDAAIAARLHQGTGTIVLGESR